MKDGKGAPSIISKFQIRQNRVRDDVPYTPFCSPSYVARHSHSGGQVGTLGTGEGNEDGCFVPSSSFSPILEF